MRHIRTLARRARVVLLSWLFYPAGWLFHACSFLRPTSQLLRLSWFTEKVQASHFYHMAQTSLLLSLSSLPASRRIRSCVLASLNGQAALPGPQLAPTGVPTFSAPGSPPSAGGLQGLSCCARASQCFGPQSSQSLLVRLLAWEPLITSRPGIRGLTPECLSAGHDARFSPADFFFMAKLCQ